MRAWHASRGFTLVELIMVLILLGVMAVVLLPGMGGTSAVKERGFRDGVFTTLSHARRVAVASRRFVCVNLTAGTGTSATVSVAMDPGSTPETASSIACSLTVPLPSTLSACTANTLCAPSGVTLGGASSVVFDPLGRSVSAPGTLAAATVTVSNQTSVTVAAETGLVQ